MDKTQEIELDRTGDATQGSAGGGQAFAGQKKEEEKDELPPSATKGKIIDTMG